jgi:hypothetical protein
MTESTIIAIVVATGIVAISLTVAFILWAAVRNHRKSKPKSKPKNADTSKNSASSGAGHGEHHGSHGQKKGNFWGNVARVVGTLLVLSLAFNISLCGYRWYKDTSTPASKTAPEYPYSGTGRGTKTEGVKAYLNPRKAYTRISNPAKFVFVANPSLYFEDKMPGVIDRTPLSQIWHNMPPGEYLVYPIEDETLDFTWWHKQ